MDNKILFAYLILAFKAPRFNTLEEWRSYIETRNYIVPGWETHYTYTWDGKIQHIKITDGNHTLHWSF